VKPLKILLITASLLLAITLVATASPLSAATTKSLSTNFTLVNLGSTEANVIASYYKPDGTTWDADDANESFTIAADYGQKIIAQYFDNTLAAGQGSVVLSSNQPLGAVTQILARGQVPTSGAYIGVGDPNQIYYAPQIFSQLPSASGLQNSQIAIQNTTEAIITVTVEFIPFPGITGLSTYTNSSITIEPGASLLYDLADEANLTSTNPTVTGWTGSAVVSAGVDETISVLVNTFAGPNSLQTYNAFSSADVGSSWSIPQFVSKLNNGLNTPVLVQNLSGSEIPVDDLTLSCVAATGFTPATFEKTNATAIPANATFAFNPYGSSNTEYPPHWSGTCSLKSASDKDIVALVQMRKPGVNEELAAYEGIRGDLTDTQVIVPLISKNQANGFATAVTIKNLDLVNAAEVTLVYTPSESYVAGGGSADVITFDATIPANGNLIQSQRFTGTPQIPDGWYGSLLVGPKTGETPRPLGALVQLTNTVAQPGDTFMAHMAFTQP
jgi:hypothetical protein